MQAFFYSCLFPPVEFQPAIFVLIAVCRQIVVIVKDCKFLHELEKT